MALSKIVKIGIEDFVEQFSPACAFGFGPWIPAATQFCCQFIYYGVGSGPPGALPFDPVDIIFLASDLLRLRVRSIEVDIPFLTLVELRECVSQNINQFRGAFSRAHFFNII